MKLNREYSHLSFTKKWALTSQDYVRIGQCIGYMKAINNTPILPDFYTQLMNVALKKGAQSTTAIEGNTLTDDEISMIASGKDLAPSKEYQQIEVQNILDALNELLTEIVYNNKDQLITEKLLLRFHVMVGKNLGDRFGAIPGRFRESDVVVGTYRCPDYRDVPILIERYCNWLREEFKYEQGKQTFSDVFIQAVVAHVYLEWIHPFGDGNGRTGRLLEFYILSRGGNPDITLHILSNYYNLTRPEYYRQLDKASKTGDLSEFIQYALLGFRDGLKESLEKIQKSQLQNTWQKFVFEKFENVEMGQKNVFKRRRRLGLEIPIDQEFSINEIPELNIKLAGMYSGISRKTLERDIEELIKNEIIIKIENKLLANVTTLTKMISRRKLNPNTLISN